VSAVLAGGFVVAMAQESTIPCDCQPEIAVQLNVPESLNWTFNETLNAFICTGGSCVPDSSCEFQYTLSEYCVVAGRPFTMSSGADLVAETCHDARAAGWTDEIAPGAPISADQTASADLARQWQRAALAEHASVASFSRVSLELMAVGAPPSLVEGVHSAALDEIRHARTAFGLAKLFGHPDAGPGPFPVPSSLEISTDLPDVIARTFREGCVSETVAAALARHRLSQVARDGPEAAALGVVVADEARHAALSWRIVAWGSGAGGAEVSGRLSDERTRIESQLLSVGELEGAVLRFVTLPWIDSLLAFARSESVHEASGWPPQAVAESDGSSVPDVVLDTAREIAQEITDMWDRFYVNAHYHQRTDASAV